MSTTTQARSLIKKWLGDYLVTTTYTNEEIILTHASRFLPLPYGAVTSGPATVTVGTTTVTGSASDGFTVERFGLRRKFDVVWPAGVQIVVTYTVGWNDGSEPQEIKDAITLLTQWYDTTPATGLAEIEIGNASARRVGFNNAEGQVTPPQHVRDLLRGWQILNVN